MIDPVSTAVAALCAALPRSPGDELILRGEGASLTATLRADGQPPRVFERCAEGVRELLPIDDEKLPGRALLAAPALLAEALEPRTGPIAASRIVAWRPGRRAVVRVALRDGGVVWLKLLDARGWQRAVRAFDAVRAALPPMHLCLPMHRLEEQCAYVAPAARGVALRSQLGPGAPSRLAVLVRALLALSYTQVAGELPVLDFAAARAQAIAMLGKAVVMFPRLDGISAAVSSLASPPPPRVSGFVHGDLHDKQLFVHDEGASLIDLDGVATGDPRLDLANLAEHVRLRDLQHTGRDGGLADVLLARCGLDPGARPTRAFRAVVRARLCGVYAMRPRWSELVDRLCTETMALMEGLP